MGMINPYNDRETSNTDRWFGRKLFWQDIDWILVIIVLILGIKAIAYLYDLSGTTFADDVERFKNCIPQLKNLLGLTH